MSEEEFEVTPKQLTIKQGRNLCHEIDWEFSSDLMDVIHEGNKRFPLIPLADTCEGGAVLICFDVDGQFDQVIAALPPGRNDRDDLVDQMLSVRDIADDIGRALDHILSGKPLRKSTWDVVCDQAREIEELRGETA